MWYRTKGPTKFFPRHVFTLQRKNFVDSNACLLSSFFSSCISLLSFLPGDQVKKYLRQDSLAQIPYTFTLQSLGKKIVLNTLFLSVGRPLPSHLMLMFSLLLLSLSLSRQKRGERTIRLARVLPRYKNARPSSFSISSFEETQLWFSLDLPINAAEWAGEKNSSA